MNELANNSATVQVTDRNNGVIISIDITNGNSIGIVKDGYKVFVNGEALKIENSSTNE